MGVIFTLSILVSPVFFYTLFSKFDAQSLENNYQLLYIGSIIIVFQLLNFLLTALLTSYKYFTAAILSGLFNSLFAITFTVIFHNKLGVAGTMQGMALGYVINFVLLVFILKRFQHWKFSNVGWMKSKKAWSDIGFMQVNILPVWIRNYATLYLLSGLGNGIITAVIVAQQIALVIDVMFTNQVLSVVGIKLSECNSKKDFESANKIFILTSTILLFLILPCVTLVVIYSHEILSFLFAVKSFDSTSAANIELCLRYLIVLAPLNMLNGLYTRFFTSFQIINKTVRLSIIGHTFFLILAVLFIKVLGLPGYLYSQIAGYTLLISLFYMILRRELPFIKFNRTVLFGIKQIIFNVIIAAVFWQLNNKFFHLEGIVLLVLAFSLQFLFILIVNCRNPFVINFKNQIYEFSNKISP